MNLKHAIYFTHSLREGATPSSRQRRQRRHVHRSLYSAYLQCTLACIVNDCFQVGFFPYLTRRSGSKTRIDTKELHKFARSDQTVEWNASQKNCLNVHRQKYSVTLQGVNGTSSESVFFSSDSIRKLNESCVVYREAGQMGAVGSAVCLHGPFFPLFPSFHVLSRNLSCTPFVSFFLFPCKEGTKTAPSFPEVKLYVAAFVQPTCSQSDRSSGRFPILDLIYVQRQDVQAVHTHTQTDSPCKQMYKQAANCHSNLNVDQPFHPLLLLLLRCLILGLA
mmetsp:Transcript_54751/g.107110  ORF Transcript_54751/g.107110 Transcript_54751/m.107110 type:complete len:277 (-) Transcript_54751:529-1359(-)